MGSPITSSPDFVIRSLTTAPEIEAFYWLNAQTFRPHHDTALIAAQRRRFITEAPDFHPEQLRGAFLGDTYLGGYRIPAFTMHMGPARLRICGIGGVVTHPAYRYQGIAPAQSIPSPLLPLLAILFPQEPAWIAGSNSY